MSRTKAIRVAGFVGALCASAALIGGTAATTGAYFTDSHDGSITASSGHLRLDVSADQLQLSFTDLAPGEYQTKTIGYSTDSTTNEDVWLVFTPGTAYGQFTGAKGDAAYPDGGLGRFGHFAVADNGTTRFTSYNLANAPAGVTGQSCPVDANGNGGSNQQPTSPTDTPPYCGVPLAIKLADNLPGGTTGQTVQVTFGVTGRWTAQDSPVTSVPFKLVATQHGVRPDASNF